MHKYRKEGAAPGLALLMCALQAHDPCSHPRMLGVGCRMQCVGFYYYLNHVTTLGFVVQCSAPPRSICPRPHTFTHIMTARWQLNHGLVGCPQRQHSRSTAFRPLCLWTRQGKGEQKRMRRIRACRSYQLWTGDVARVRVSWAHGSSDACYRE